MFPQLVLVRLLFSIGGAAASTMVTAILPSMIAPHKNSDRANLPNKTLNVRNCHEFSPSISSELTVTPQRLHHHQPAPRRSSVDIMPTRLAGVVGIFTGCGALLALGFFLRLPDIIQRMGTSPGEALADTYYIVGALSLVLALLCFLGLRNLHGEDEKGWRNLIYGGPDDLQSKLSSLRSLVDAVVLGFKDPLLGLGYLGGFVARASVRLFGVITSSTTECLFWYICFESQDSWHPLHFVFEVFIRPLGTNETADPKMCSRLRFRSSFPYS